MADSQTTILVRRKKTREIRRSTGIPLPWEAAGRCYGVQRSNRRNASPLLEPDRFFLLLLSAQRATLSPNPAVPPTKAWTPRLGARLSRSVAGGAVNHGPGHQPSTDDNESRRNAENARTKLAPPPPS